MIRILPVAAAAALALTAAAAPAQAGTYQVRSCVTDTGNFANNAWTVRDSRTITTDNKCGTSATDAISAAGKAGAAIAGGDYEALNFTAPAGTTIADWRINRRWTLRGTPAKDVPRPYLTYVYGPRNVFGGAGYYTPAVRDELNRFKAWGGYPSKDFSYSGTTPRSSWRSLAGDAPESSLSVRVGCLTGTCTIPSGGLVENAIIGSVVTISDPTGPTVAVQAAGLLSAGPQPGSAPIMVTATDASGIRSIQAIDVTDPAAPTVVGSETYDPADADATTTGAGAKCDYTRTAPCPQLSGETLTPTSLQAGKRSLVVRVTDTAGNVSDNGPYPVDVSSPSDRGAANGTGATATGKLGGSFAGKKKRPRTRTVDYGSRPKLSGKLVNDAGQPVAGAKLVVSQRVAGKWSERGTITTGREGKYRLRVKSGPSRIVRIGWRARTNDVSATEKVDFDLRVRGGASLTAPKSVRLGSSFTLRGRVKGSGSKRRISIVAQGKGSRGGFQTFRDTRTDGKGRIKIRYRFTQPGSRGSTFRIRVKLLSTKGWPYASGVSKTVRVRVR